MQRVLAKLAVPVMALAGALLASSRAAVAQSDEPRPQGPRFLLASADKAAPPRPVDVSKTPLLRRQLVIDLRDVPIKQALASVIRQSGLDLLYSDDVLPAGARVTLQAQSIALAAALTSVLLEADVDVVFARDGRAMLVKRPPPPAVGTITGRITERLTSQPIPGVQVLVAGTQLGRISGDDGRYTIAGVPAGRHDITARRVGYAAMTQSVTVADNASATADFALERSAAILTEMVSTATGDQRRVEIGNALSLISADSVFATTPTTGVDQLLMGRVPGLQVLFTSGFSGQSSRIRIRGISGLASSNDPLVIMDGVRVEGKPGGVTGGNPSSFTSGRMADIMPEDIESVEVVKGPSAATLYGTDAANGVIVIKTKHGSAGRRKFSTYVEQGTLGDPIKFPTNYFAWGHPTGAGAAPLQCFLVDRAEGRCVTDSITTFSPLNDPTTTPFGRGYRSVYAAQLSGRSGDVSYYLSGTREDEQGFLEMPKVDRALNATRGIALTDENIHPNGYSKTSFRGNFGSQLSDRSDVGLQFGYINNRTRIPNAANNVVYSGEWAPGFRGAPNGGWLVANGRPADNFLVRGVENANRFTTSLTANLGLTEGFSLRGTGGIDLTADEYDGLQRFGQGPASGQTGLRQTIRNTPISYTFDGASTYSRHLSAAFSSRTTAGLQYTRRNETFVSATASGLLPGAETVAGAAVVTGAEQTIQTAVAGGYLEENIGLHDRLWAVAALRFDGSSSFGSGFRSAVYPKTSVSWLVRRPDDTGQFSSWLSNLRLRAAFGGSGVQPPSTAAIQRDSLFTAATWNGTPTGAAQIISIGNSKLRPERQTELESGLESELFGGRVSVEATFYQRTSKDALVPLPLPPSLAIYRQFVNIGSVRNRGLEGNIKVRALDNRVLWWDIGTNGFVNKNTLLSLNSTVTAIAAFSGSGNPTSVVGYPVLGYWAKPILSYTTNSEGIVLRQSIRVGDTAVYLGSSQPTHQQSYTTSVGFLRDAVVLSALVDYRGGWVRPFFTDINRCYVGYGAYAMHHATARGVNDPSAPASEQAACLAYSYDPSATFWGTFKEASYARWRELSAVVRLPQSVVRPFRAETGTITFTGRNLWLWTKNPQSIDPESTVATNITITGTELGIDAYPLDNNTMPMPKIFTIRLSLHF